MAALGRLLPGIRTSKPVIAYRNDGQLRPAPAPVAWVRRLLCLLELEHVSPLAQLVQVVSPGLHHRPTLIHVFGPVVGRP